MLSSITPLGERGRDSRWPVTASAYVLGSALGGSAVGTACGLVGQALPLGLPPVGAAAVVLLAVGCLLAALVETARLPRLPTWQRQVDEDWLHRYRGWVYGLGYGVQLGVGLVTIVTSPTLYAALALAVLTGSPGRGALVGVAFGLARGLPVLGMRRVTTFAQLTGVHRRLEAQAPAGRAAAASLLVVVALAAAVQLVSTGVTGS